MFWVVLRVFWACFGVFGGMFWGMFGGVSEAFLWYFGRFLGGKNKENQKRKNGLKTYSLIFKAYFLNRSLGLVACHYFYLF